jgi:hypothetical protein
MLQVMQALCAARGAFMGRTLGNAQPFMFIYLCPIGLETVHCVGPAQLDLES